jgi:membrane-bound metal-dependent hydrolase YbcI (DUF457 family)
MSWSAHEFENYFIQKHVGVKASFIAIAAGTMLPDFFTKKYVYTSADPTNFHRSLHGVGFTHSFMFGLVFAVLVLALTRSRSWALGMLMGQWAHVASDMFDSAGVLPFFPFSTEPVTIGMWRHAAGTGRLGDAAAFYSSLGGVMDFLWLVVVVVFARAVLRADYFRQVVMPADPKVWSFLHRRLHISDNGMLVLYRGMFLFGLSRMITWFLYARFDAKAPFQAIWGGPRFVPATDLSDAGVLEMLVRTAIGGALFAGFLWLTWIMVIRRLWQRGADPPIVARGEGLHAAFH